MTEDPRSISAGAGRREEWMEREVSPLKLDERGFRREGEGNGEPTITHKGAFYLSILRDTKPVLNIHY